MGGPAAVRNALTHRAGHTHSPWTVGSISLEYQTYIPTYSCNWNGATWWSNLELIQVEPHVGQIWNHCKWCHLVAKFVTNVSVEITRVIESIPWVLQYL